MRRVCCTDGSRDTLGTLWRAGVPAWRLPYFTVYGFIPYHSTDHCASVASLARACEAHPAKTYLELPTLDMSRRRATS